jgi:hypothetical protein
MLVTIFIDAIKDNEAFREKFYRKFKAGETADIGK